MYEIQLLTMYGWECVDAADSRKEALESRDNYRRNDPSGTYRVRIVRD